MNSESQRRRGRVSWSNLTPELLVSIAERLRTRADILSFRGVCKSWRVSATLSLLNSVSKNTLSPLFPHTLPNKCVILARSVFLVRSAKNPKLTPWLFFVDEVNPGKLSLRNLFYYASEYIPKDFPKVLDLSRFHISELGRFHTPRYVRAGKVVVFVDPNCKTCPTINDCTFLLKHYREGLLAIRPGSEEKTKLSFKGRRLMDAVNFQGKLYAIDRFGRLCSIAYGLLKKSCVAQNSSGMLSGRNTIHYLVVSSCGGELYFVNKWDLRVPAFKVFKLNEKNGKWDRVDGIGDDRILVLTSESCFFASSNDFPGWKGNCIVSNGCGVLTVFHLEGVDYGTLSRYPGYENVFQPPPTWIWTDEGLSTGGSDYEGRGREDGVEEEENWQEEEVGEVQEAQSDSSCQIELSSNSVQASGELQTTQRAIDLNEFEEPNNVDSAPLRKSLLKTAETGVPQVKFVGVNVSSHLVPILQKIWDNHGNIMEGLSVLSNNLLTWALESLAKIIIILQSNSRKTLDDSNAKYSYSTLHDLQLMHFKLDWLVPVVGKALAFHHSKVNSVTELEMAESKLQAELHELKNRLAEQRKLGSESQLGSASLRMNGLLG